MVTVSRKGSPTMAAKAILSVHDKTGLVEFARGLSALGWDLLASGWSRRMLRESHIPVRDVADYHQFPEVLGGA